MIEPRITCTLKGYYACTKLLDVCHLAMFQDANGSRLASRDRSMCTSSKNQMGGNTFISM